MPVLWLAEIKEEYVMIIKHIQPGTHVNWELVLTQATKRMTKGTPPRPFAALTFSDGQETISGNLWNYTEDKLPETNKVYKLEADIGEYNGTKQLNNIQMQLSPNQDLTPFAKHFGELGQVPSAWNDIKGYIAGIKSTPLQNFLDELVLMKEKQWFAASSAISMHHAGMGGNIAHTYEVMVIADSIAHMVEEIGYPVARDLVIAGAILHDVGKLETYRVEGPAVEFTMDGVLADHIGIGTRMLWATDAAKQWPGVARLLEHIILSHHGKLEFGCPVVPKMIEAEIVMHADGMSASMAIYREAEEKARIECRKGSLTERIWAVGNSQLPRRYYVEGVLKAAGLAAHDEDPGPTTL